MTDVTIDGLVLYADGSFRGGRAGWGVHGYTYQNTPLKQGIGIKQLPTTDGYAEVPLTESVTVLEYIDLFGPVHGDQTNNTGELYALIEAIKFGLGVAVSEFTVFTDSEYVQKGYTRYLDRWQADNWTKKTGEPVANLDIWKQVVALRDQLKTEGKTLVLKWIKGHSGHVGNTLADMNARTGSGEGVTGAQLLSPPVKYHNPESDGNPLILRTRMLFNIGGPAPAETDVHYYYLYQLGSQRTYGHKQGDSVNDRHNKTDLLLGRRISDATFCVLKLNTPDAFLESLKAYHAKAHLRDTIELAVARLDNAYRPMWQQRIQQFGENALIANRVNQSLVTPYDDLITKTLNPPRLAMEAVEQFSTLQNRLNAVLANDGEAKGLTTLEITDQLYREEQVGKKSVIKLHSEITTTTPYLTVPTQFKGHDVVLKLVLGIDIPVRNTLAKLAARDTVVTVVIVATGPLSYTYATVFQTAEGAAIYQSPYSQFVIPKS